jgi:hypothetical protein
MREGEFMTTDYMTTDQRTPDSEGSVVTLSRGPVVSLHRFPDWPSRLAALIEERRGVPFKWGKQDCCLFAADWILRATGKDIAAPLRGYRSALGALRRVESMGETVEDVPGHLGLREVPATMAWRGDLVSVDTPTGVAICVCDGNRLVGAGPDGLAFLERREARRAWRI